MSSTLEPRPIAGYERKLKERFLALRREIRDGLLRADRERYADIAGAVHDAEDEAVADLLVDINHAEVNRDVDELRDVDGALQRIALGRYGVCIDCGEEIAIARLDAYPTAKRCGNCQRVRETARAGILTPKL